MTPHGEAWPREDRLRMMKKHILYMAEEGMLHRVSSGHLAASYGTSVAEVDAEKMRHLSEGEGK